MTFDVRGRTAVLTGAGSGIGRATALRLARAGTHLALVERNADSLAAVAAMAREFGVTVSEHVVDVADKDAILALPEAVLGAHRGVDILMNNAGVALVGTFDLLSLEEYEWLIDINFWGVVRMTHAFLPLLRRAPAAHVVNISSVFGIVAPAGQSAYAAAKFGVRGFSESVRQEWKDSNITLTVVHPGGIRTSIARQARVAAAADQALAEKAKSLFDKLLITSADKAAAKIVSAIEHRRKRLLIGPDAAILSGLQRLLPTHYNDVIDALNKVGRTGEIARRATRMQGLTDNAGASGPARKAAE